MSHEEQRRQAVYDSLHKEDQLRFPLQDYPTFYEWLNIPSQRTGLKLLDIACGQGFFLEEAEKASTSLELHGLDFSAVALDFAKQRLARTRLEQASAYAMPYEDTYFDYIVNLGSLEHFDDPDKALLEMRRVLKPNGKAMIIVPNQYYLGSIWKVAAYGITEDQGQEGVTYFRTLNEWKDVFLRNDLDIAGVRGYSGEHHIAWYFQRENNQVTEQEIAWRNLLNTWVKPIIPLPLSQCFVFTLRPQP